MLPVPHVPDGHTIAPTQADQQDIPAPKPSCRNGIVERFHRTLLDAFHRIALRKRIYAAIDELQADLDAWLTEYNEVRTHQGRCCYGKTPLQTSLDAAPPPGKGRSQSRPSVPSRPERT